MSTALQQALALARQSLRDHDSAAPEPDNGVTARLGPGLRIEATDDTGTVRATDMPAEIGGGGSAPTPGTLMRAALACCNATTVAIVAAEQGVQLDRLEVRVDSVSDPGGVFGEPGARVGPLQIEVRYTIESAVLSDSELRDLVEQSLARSPVSNALTGSVPLTVTIDSAVS